jgi:hypothetical protein
VKSGRRAEREQKPGKHKRALVTAPRESWSTNPSRDVLQGPLHDVVVRGKASSGRSGPGRDAGRTRFVRARPARFLASTSTTSAHAFMHSLSSVASVKISSAGQPARRPRPIHYNRRPQRPYRRRRKGYTRGRLPKVRSVHLTSDSHSSATANLARTTRSSRMPC